MQTAIIREIGQLRQQLSSDLQNAEGRLGEQITTEGKKTSQELGALRERLKRIERRLPKK